MHDKLDYHELNGGGVQGMEPLEILDYDEIEKVWTLGGKRLRPHQWVEVSVYDTGWVPLRYERGRDKEGSPRPYFVLPLSIGQARVELPPKLLARRFR